MWQSFTKPKHSIALIRCFLPTLGLVLLLLAVNNPLLASDVRLQVSVTTQDQKPLIGAVVTFLSEKGPSFAPQKSLATMTQRGKQFRPHILAVQQGTQIHFPNQDPIKHHVYSFSKTKSFQLKLYRDVSPTPLMFDQPGVVTIGCNIHDWMLGYIYVTETPYFAQITQDQPVATIHLPADTYQFRVWHPRMKPEDLNRVQTLKIDTSTQMSFQVQSELLPDLSQYSQSKGDGSY